MDELPIEARPEDRFRLIFESAPFAILLADDEGRYLDANPMACQMFGLPRQQLVGRRLYDFVDRGDLTTTREVWQAFRSNEPSTTSGEFRLVRSDGQRRLLRYRALADVAPGWHLSFLEDITETRAAEDARAQAERERAAAENAARRALEASERHFRSLADGLPVLIWLGDADGNSLYFNRHWFEFTGLPPGPSRLEDAVHPEDLPRVAPLLRQSRQDGTPLDQTFRVRRKDGQYHWYLYRALAVRDESGRIVRQLASATEIEDERRASDDLRLERELRERFVATVSHDLRSPLAAVKMAAQLIMRSPAQGEVMAHRIARSVDHAEQLIQNLLDASLITAGQPLPVHRASCNLGELTAEVIADLATVHGDRFHLQTRGRLDAALDRAAMRRLLENLLGNAVKYGDPDGPVTARLEGEGPWLILAVHNQGNPIPLEQQTRIFSPYHRIGTTQPGWGLGLTLVRGVAAAHGGTVRVESAPEIGTTFTVTLRREVL